MFGPHLKDVDTAIPIGRRRRADRGQRPFDEGRPAGIEHRLIGKMAGGDGLSVFFADVLTGRSNRRLKDIQGWLVQCSVHRRIIDDVISDAAIDPVLGSQSSSISWTSTGCPRPTGKVVSYLWRGGPAPSSRRRAWARPRWPPWQLAVPEHTLRRPRAGLGASAGRSVAMRPAVPRRRRDGTCRGLARTLRAAALDAAEQPIARSRPAQLRAPGRALETTCLLNRC
jgi:hypothetical protein